MQKPRIPSGEKDAILGPQLSGGLVTPCRQGIAARSSKALSRTAEVRLHKRHPFLATVHLRGIEGEAFQAVDLSVGGVGLIGSRRLGVGRLVDVAFLNRSMVVKGIIRAERESGLPRWRIGIQFLQPQPELLEVALAASASAD